MGGDALSNMLLGKKNPETPQENRERWQYHLDVASSQDSSGKLRFIGIPYWKYNTLR